MSEEYNFKEIEKKWQEIWENEGYGIADKDSVKPKFYSLVEFPYPSGYGLHVGHCMGYGASDVNSRMKRIQGYNVMYPMGWDAFGLPTENFAIKNKVKPQKITEQAISTFKKQMKSLGYSFDWSREINTTDPSYYKWTQLIFLQFYKHAIIDGPSTGSGQGKLIRVADNDTTTPRLAFQAEMPVNWCPSCKIVLANEEVISGKCERCGTEAEKKSQKQWMLRITAYADRLIDDLKTVDYLEKIKTQQINWIGRSEGANIIFKLMGDEKLANKRIEVFTTRADTLFGCTYVVLAPEHQLVSELLNHAENQDEVKKYIEKAKKKSDLERTELQKEKTGVEIKGIKAINPINGEEVSVWIADYVLASYGTGAVMAVPAHDERDFEFAKKYGIPIKEVVIPKVIDKHDPPKDGVETIFRKAIQAIVINPKNKKVLALKWKKFPWTTFVTGGIEGEEDTIAAAKREILEETGYKNVKYVKTLGGPVESHFYANHKGVNRKAHFYALLFELENEEITEIAQEEHEIHEVIWMSWDELEKDKNVKCSEYDIWLDRLNSDGHAFTNYGIVINSGEFSNLDSETAKHEITQKLEKNHLGKFSVNYKLRDWIFSRQHYWGEPIPIVHCEKCGTVPVPEDQLPITLPEIDNYEPTDTGESPLAKISSWVETTCPKCGGTAKRETDTMPNWAGSSWYFLRYCDPHDSDGLASEKKLKEWMPVDLYNGGMEHTTLHLLYSRFWNKFLFDLGVASTSEPYSKRIAHGIILGPDGRKMSKSFGNVINPDDIANKYGADTLRMYIAFIGPYDQESAWNTAGVQGVYRFLKRVWNNQNKTTNSKDSDELLVKLNQTIAGVTDDFENFRMNTAVSKLMELNNLIEKIGHISTDNYKKFLILLFPIVPHIASELWSKIDSRDQIFQQVWPAHDKKYLISSNIEVVIQINGKVREKIIVQNDISDEELKETALKNQKIEGIIEGKTVKKIIIVPKKLVSIVTD